MSEWVQITMHEVGYLENGLVPYFSGVTSYLATADVVGYKKQPSEEVSYYSRPSRAQIYLAVGDVLQAKMRETNKSFVVDSNLEGWLASTGFARFKPERVGNLPLYVYYIVTSEFFLRERDRLCVGSTQQAISDRDLRDIYVRLPRSLHEQEKIAHILQTIDHAIEKTEALIDKYQQIKAGLMHDLFTRGIGPDGQLRPPREQAPELYQETPIGWIPKEWEAPELSSICKHEITYGIVQAGPHLEGGVPYIRTGDMDGDYLAPDKLLRTSTKIASQYKRSEVRAREIVCAIRATVGKVLRVPEELDGANLTQGTARISPSEKTDVSFILWAFRSDLVQRLIKISIKGTTFNEITLGDLRRIKFPIPKSKKEQRRIGQRLDQCESLLLNEKEVLQKLKRQKSGLMHDLLTGKVPVQVDEPETDPEAAHV